MSRKILNEAHKLYETADHLAYTTYKFVEETRLLIAIIEKIYELMEKGIDALIAYENSLGRVSTGTKFDVFRMRCMKRYNLKTEYWKLFSELKIILEEHKNSPATFIKKDKLIICNPKYRTRILNIDKVKEYLRLSKNFLEDLGKIIK